MSLPFLTSRDNLAETVSGFMPGKDASNSSREKVYFPRWGLEEIQSDIVPTFIITLLIRLQK